MSMQFVQPPQPVHKPLVHRLSKDSALPYTKPSLSATNSSGSSTEMGGASSMEGINRSPSLTPRALTPTNSYDSTNSGRGSPSVGVASPSSGQEVPVQVCNIIALLVIVCCLQYSSSHCLLPPMLFYSLFVASPGWYRTGV